MSPPIRSAIRFSILVAVLTVIAIFVPRKWPDWDVPVQVALNAAYVVYFIRFAIKQDRTRRSA